MNPIEREKYLDDAQLSKLMAAARSSGRHAKRNHLMLAVLVNVGCRPSEGLALRVGDLTLTDNAPRVRVRRLKKRRDDGVIDDLEISRTLGRALRAYVKGKPLDARLFPIALRTAQHVFKGCARAAGLPEHVRIYALRHTALTRAWRHSHDLVQVMRQAGHAAITTTQIYMHSDPRLRRETAEAVGAVL